MARVWGGSLNEGKLPEEEVMIQTGKIITWRTNNASFFKIHYSLHSVVKEMYLYCLVCCC